MNAPEDTFTKLLSLAREPLPESTKTHLTGRMHPGVPVPVPVRDVTLQAKSAVFKARGGELYVPIAKV